MSIDHILDGIIRREGTAYTDDPVDRGGPTKFGITQDVLSAWRGRAVPPYEVAALTQAEALEIYRSRYVAPFGFIADPKLQHLLVDCGVNHGVSRAKKWLQTAAGVVADGFIGPRTRQAVLAADPHVLYAKVCGIRTRFYGRIIANDHSQARFAAGWANRNAEFIEDCA